MAGSRCPSIARPSFELLDCRALFSLARRQAGEETARRLQSRPGRGFDQHPRGMIIVTPARLAHPFPPCHGVVIAEQDFAIRADAAVCLPSSKHCDCRGQLFRRRWLPQEIDVRTRREIRASGQCFPCHGTIHAHRKPDRVGAIRQLQQGGAPRLRQARDHVAQKRRRRASRDRLGRDHERDAAPAQSERQRHAHRDRFRRAEAKLAQSTAGARPGANQRPANPRRCFAVSDRGFLQSPRRGAGGQSTTDDDGAATAARRQGRGPTATCMFPPNGAARRSPKGASALGRPGGTHSSSATRFATCCASMRPPRSKPLALRRSVVSARSSASMRHAARSSLHSASIAPMRR